MKPIIEIRNLSKKYSFIHQPEGYLALRDVFANAAKKPLDLFKSKNKKSTQSEIFWALKDIDLKVLEGEVLGIIGPNGAGKTTLLKILTRITPPTTGEVILRGKVASLLEVGTGFHPELTGRENIFLNGAILGMRRREVRRKFDEIVEFSGVEKFLDMPVKRYSSGMEVRLAFSVAAHLEPDILLVDEVLAVGDSEFQKKSLGKMEAVSKQGRTVLFVSHNLPAITSLSQNVIWLKSGKITKAGNPQSVVTDYLQKAIDIKPKRIFSTQNGQVQNELVRLISVRAIDNDGKTANSFDIRRPIKIEVDYHIKKPNVKIACNLQVKNSSGILLFNSPENTKENTLTTQRVGNFRSSCFIPGNFLAEGVHTLRMTISELSKSRPSEIDLPEAITFNVHDLGKPGAVKKAPSFNFPGVLRPMLHWQRTKIDNRGK